MLLLIITLVIFANLILVLTGLNIYKNRVIDELAKNSDKSFTLAQESIVNEISYAINNLKAGRYEEVYTSLTNLADELTKDIIISKTEDFDELIAEASQEYIKKN